MKKKNLKSLKLNKHAISSFKNNTVKGGDSFPCFYLKTKDYATNCLSRIVCL